MIRRMIFPIFIILLTGCMNRNEYQQISASPAKPTLYEAISPTVAPSHSIPEHTLTPEYPIGTKTTITPTTSPTPTFSRPIQSPPETQIGFPTPLPNSTVIQKCLSSNDLAEASDGLTGILVLANRLPDDKPYLLNLKSNEKMDIPFSQGENKLWLDYAAVSPDGSWLAFIELLKDSSFIRLHLLSNQLIEKQSINLPEGWGTIVTWLDNQRILLTTYRELPEDTFPTGEMAILNPFTGSWEVLSPNLPKQISTDPMPWYYWPDNPIVFYNPSLGRAVYLSVDGFFLIDPKTEEIITGLRTASYRSHPTWSPQGDTFAMVIDNPEYHQYHAELYQFDQEGQSVPLTNLADAFGNNNVGIEAFQWSPDGKKIAFSYYVNDYKLNKHIAVLDINSGQVVDYCLPSIGLPPVWSPDSQSIAFASGIFDGTKEPDWQTVVINTVTDKAYEVAQTMLPLGWMAAPEQ